MLIATWATTSEACHRRRGLRARPVLLLSGSTYAGYTYGGPTGYYGAGGGYGMAGGGYYDGGYAGGMAGYPGGYGYGYGVRPARLRLGRHRRAASPVWASGPVWALAHRVWARAASAGRRPGWGVRPRPGRRRLSARGADRPQVLRSPCGGAPGLDLRASLGAVFSRAKREPFQPSDSTRARNLFPGHYLDMLGLARLTDLHRLRSSDRAPAVVRGGSRGPPDFESGPFGPTAAPRGVPTREGRAAIVPGPSKRQGCRSSGEGATDGSARCGR